MAADAREHEVVLWGATGFTGQLTAEHLSRRAAAEGDLRWAIGGRNATKLEAVRAGLASEVGVDSSGLPLLVGDSDDDDFLDDLTRSTKVVCSTVGPYAKYGSKLVAACARNGTDYCDLTGEVHWMQRMIEAYEDIARSSGARLVFTCGFDCIPSDLGVFFLQREMQARHGVPCSHVQYRVEDFSGAASGGTIASMLTMMEEAERDPSVEAAMKEPYSLNPKDERLGPDRPERLTPSYDDDFAEWVAPFMMAGINTKVVRRTNAVLGFPYGRDFRYDEAMLMGGGPLGLAKAAAASAGSAAMSGGMSVGWLRRAVSGRLPQPGDGPSREKQQKGFFDIRFRGVHPTDRAKTLWGRVHGDRDPGYGSTSKMLGESALCLAHDDLAVGGGFWTPASAMGDPLLVRLADHAGVVFSLD